MASNKTPTYGNGKICYLEIPSINIGESANFYSSVFCWQIRSHGDGNLSFDDAVGEVSGMWVTGRKIASEPGIILSIMVDDAEKTIDLIIAHGGQIVRPIGMDAPEITAWFTDPAGNVFGIYQHRA